MTVSQQTPQLAGHLGHRAGVQAHLQAALKAGAVGEQAPGRERGRGLDPGDDQAGGLLAAEAALAPAQARRAAEGGQIAVVDRAAAVRSRHHPAPRTADRLGHELDHDDHLARVLLDVEDPEPGQAKQRLSGAGSVGHVKSLPVVAALVSRNDAGGS
jgi:hypothetical protein